MTVPITAFSEIQWPAIPSPYSARLQAVLFQLEQTQWWPAEQLVEQQFRQIRQVVAHTYETVPFYRQRFDAQGMSPAGVCTPENWTQLPLLTRRDIQTAGASLHSSRVPKGHGTVGSTMTSGSTAQPVVVQTTEMTAFFWRALTLRDHFWHRRDFSQSFAAIRQMGRGEAAPPHGATAGNWGSATAATIPTGPAHLLNIQSTLEEQVAWLCAVDPHYVLSYPSVLLAIAQLLESRGEKLTNLREIRTFGEILEPECRAICQRVFRCKIVDMYSSQEVGYIALQCPEHDHYHLQSESLLVEVVDDAGRPCGPGQVGRVLVTTLHNFAMPLLRYDIGDYAEVGNACACGRNLPVVSRILGRQRNLLVLPNGDRRWPLFGEGDRPEELPAYYQFQVVQRTREDIQINVVRDGPYTEAEEAIIQRYFQQTLGYPFRIALQYVPAIPRSKSGKFEDFISQAT
jgi:phenylacetate-CoA ligase